MKLILLDRDGVINQDSDDYIKSDQEWIPVEGSIEAISQLTKSGFTVAVATNQSGLARGLFDKKALNAMHEKMLRLVGDAGGSIATIAYCPHLPADHCDCRKPAPGLIHQIENTLGVSAKGSWFVGDSFKDLQAAIAVECKPALVLTGKGKKTSRMLASEPSLASIPVFDNLAAFANFVIREL